MDRDRSSFMTSREPNPLRPYHIPPSIGPTYASPASPPQHSSRSTPASTFGSSASELFPDIGLDLKATGSEAWQQTRSLLDTLVWRYTSVLLAQPFDVAKTTLQVSLPPSNAPGSSQQRQRPLNRTYSSRSGGDGLQRSTFRSGDTDGQYSDDSDASEESYDVPDYFSSTAPQPRSPRRRRRKSSPRSELSPSTTPTPASRRPPNPEPEYKLQLKKADSIMHALSSLYNTSGALGIWRGTNCTFLYSILVRTTDSFLRSLLLALIGLPDILGPEPVGLGAGLNATGVGFSGLDISHSPSPIGSLVVVGLASCITGLLLAPVDLVRTRLIVAPTYHPPRGLIQNLRQLPSLVAPSKLWLPTSLYHSIPQMFSAACPLLLRRQLQLSPVLYPTLWSLAAFTTNLADLFIRLPLETVLRRAQVSTLLSTEKNMPTIIEPAPYTGVWPTVYNILYVEGETTTKDARGLLRTRRGQSMQGLTRGWRIGFWGLVGFWSMGAVGPGPDGPGRGEF